MEELRKWLRSSDADWFLDDAVLGCLSTNIVLEVAEDYGVSVRDVGREINVALMEGE